MLTILLLLNISIIAQTKIKMTLNGGVYSIPCVVNGQLLSFIFDTGAADVHISKEIAIKLLENGYLKENNILGSSYYQLANGSFVQNTQIVIEKITVGTVVLNNVRASVSNQLNSPLLFGQSAIKKLGALRLEGDYLIIENGNTLNNENDLTVTAINLLKKSFEANKNQLYFSAIELGNEYINLNPTDINGYLLQADNYNKNKNHLKSIDCLQKIILLDPYRKGFNHLIALQFQYRDDFNQAIMFYQKELNDSPNDYLSYYNMAICYSKIKNFQQSIYYNKKVIELNPNYAEAYNNTASNFNQIEEFENAVEYAEKALKINSKLEEAYYTLALAYSGLNNMNYAIINLKKAASLGHRTAQSLLNDYGVRWR